MWDIDPCLAEKCRKPLGGYLCGCIFRPVVRPLMRIIHEHVYVPD